MSDRVMRLVVGVVALGVGIAVGWLAHVRFAPPGAGGGVKVVHIDRQGMPQEDPVRISRTNGERILWIGLDSGQALTIESERQIFEQQALQHDRYAMTCVRHTCFSDAIRAGTSYGRYKYWQLLTAPGQPDVVKDGWIIIDP